MLQSRDLMKADASAHKRPYPFAGTLIMPVTRSRARSQSLCAESKPGATSKLVEKAKTRRRRVSPASTSQEVNPALPPSSTNDEPLEIPAQDYHDLARSILLEITEDAPSLSSECRLQLEKMEKEPGYALYFLRSLERRTRLMKAKPLLIQGA